MSTDVERSKFLSYVLRHAPESVGLTLDAQGWVSVETLLAALAKHGEAWTRIELETLVETSDKQRFAFSDNRTRVRAQQGHSVRFDLDYPVAEPPAVLFHGTATRFLESIRRQGLVSGDRHAVHLSESRQVAHVVGQRHGSPRVLEVRAAEMAAEGYVFRRTPNSVWLVSDVPARFLQELKPT